MSDIVLIDTDVLIDVARDIPEAVRCLQEIERQAVPAISAITHMELIIGCRNKAELKSLESFVKRFQVIELTKHISGLGVDLLRNYRLSHGLLIADSLIAATAVFLGCPLATKNQRDYRFIQDLRLLAYPPAFSANLQA